MEAFKNIVGRDNFIERHNLWSQEQKEIAAEVVRKAKKTRVGSCPPVFCRPAWHFKG